MTVQNTIELCNIVRLLLVQKPTRRFISRVLAATIYAQKTIRHIEPLELSKRAGIDLRSLDDIEQGKQLPSTTKLTNIIYALNIKISTFSKFCFWQIARIKYEQNFDAAALDLASNKQA